MKKKIILGISITSLIVSVLTFSMTLTGCKEVKIEKSEVLHEEAKVITAIHTPSRHDVNLGTKMMDDEFSIGGATDWQGRKGIAVGDVVISHTEVPENFGVLFQCQHGSFTSQGSDPRHKALYNKFQNWDGKMADVTYQEMYRVTYDDPDKDGKKEKINKVLIGFDFLDADPIKE